MKRRTNVRIGLLLVGGSYALIHGLIGLLNELDELDGRVARTRRQTRFEETTSQLMLKDLATELVHAGVIELVDEGDGMGPRPRARGTKCRAKSAGPVDQDALRDYLANRAGA